MLKFKTLTVKNFMSSGKVTQSINFENSDLSLVLGENLDLGGNDSRNGVGKSSIINAVSYALYGSAITNIKKDNLINKTNGKDMLVTLEFEKDGINYTLQRGRRPNTLSFLINGDELKDPDTNEAQGDSRVTQEEIERTINLSHTMFKNIVALNTYNVPFLSMKASDQRDLIEQLLGITKLSEKADNLKELLKQTKDELRGEELRINAIKNSNEKINSNIRTLDLKSRKWDDKHQQTLQETQEAIDTLENIDIEEEIQKHKSHEEYNRYLDDKNNILKNKKRYERELNKVLSRTEEIKDQISVTKEQKCHTCGQELHDDKHQNILEDLYSKLEERNKEKSELENKVQQCKNEEDDLSVVEDPGETFYNDIDDAYEHKSSIASLKSMLENEKKQNNPYTEQIESLSTDAIQDVDYSTIHELEDKRSHQEFLLKLLTNRDSFIRKKIIEQNLPFLNTRLNHYLAEMNLPHTVKFLSDLSVEIQEHGRDLDFDNLSRGERTRLILSLCWSFRDVYESLNNQIDMLFIDELIDNGLDTNGVEAALGVTKKMVRENNRRVMLISHRDELVGRVSNVLYVIKENGFTHFQSGDK